MLISHTCVEKSGNAIVSGPGVDGTSGESGTRQGTIMRQLLIPIDLGDLCDSCIVFFARANVTQRGRTSQKGVTVGLTVRL